MGHYQRGVATQFPEPRFWITPVWPTVPRGICHRSLWLGGLWGFAGEQDQAVGKRAAPAGVVACALELLIEHLLALGVEYVAEMAVGNQDRTTAAGHIQLHRTGVHIEADRQPLDVDEELRHVARICIIVNAVATGMNFRSASVQFCIGQETASGRFILFAGAPAKSRFVDVRWNRASHVGMNAK